MLRELVQLKTTDLATPVLIHRLVRLSNSFLAELPPALRAARPVTIRTVRYYGQEGILPPPYLLSGQARYGYEHLVRLVATRLYQGRFLPLKEIRTRLSTMERAELEEFITEAVLEAADGLPFNDAVATSPPNDVTDSTGQPVGRVIPSIPEIPGTPAATQVPILPRVPVIFESNSSRFRYRVVPIAYEDADGMEAALNSLGEEGWWLVGVVSLEGKSFFVMAKQADAA